MSVKNRSVPLRAFSHTDWKITCETLHCWASH